MFCFFDTDVLECALFQQEQERFEQDIEGGNLA